MKLLGPLGLFVGLPLLSYQLSVPVPNDPMEVATGQIRVVDSPAERAQTIRMLNSARSRFHYRESGVPTDLKVSFTVSSGGVTQYDGAWEMEDMQEPGVGFRWAARTSGYSIDQIGNEGVVYGDTAQIPLRLQQVRGSLFAPMWMPASMARALIRESNANYEGATLTCILLSGGGNDPNSPVPGRHWVETEECIDPQSGLLRIHSPAPGVYVVYDYSGAKAFERFMLPNKMTIYEAGSAVVEAQVGTVTQVQSNPQMFVPTAQMKTKGAGAQMSPLMRFPVWVPGDHAGPSRPVLVMGLLTTTDKIQEAHVIETSDSSLNQKAIEYVTQMDYRPPTPPGMTPEQHIVIVNVHF